DAAYRDLVGGACGPASVGDAGKAFHLVEDITIGRDDHGLGFGFPVPSMMTKHHSSGGLSAAIKQDHASYREALALLQAARAHSLPQGHRFLDYMVARMVFAVRYLDAAEAFGATSTAGKAGDLSAALAHVEDADTAIREALRAWVDVAGDHGDLGAVALMYKYCCHPIREKRDALKQQIAGS
ncbi:MAG: hypothetical protein GY851_10400, partial [bacterium]|nr:hypothetical protein [bacterium]